MAGVGSGASLIERSGHVAESGYVRPFAPFDRVYPSTAISIRWGGWYVSGTHGNTRHMGNELSAGDDQNFKIDTAKGANVTDLSRYLSLNKYLERHSDIVSLLVLEQQSEIQNVISMMWVDLRVAKSDADYAAAVEPFVQALVGIDEVTLPGEIKGTSSFAKDFGAMAPKDQFGRSLSQLDLKTRILKYAISPMIYAPAFEALPKPARLAIYRRLNELLSKGNPDSALSQLSPADRKAARNILIETKPEFASIAR